MGGASSARRGFVGVFTRVLVYAHFVALFYAFAVVSLFPLLSYMLPHAPISQLRSAVMVPILAAPLGPLSLVGPGYVAFMRLVLQLHLMYPVHPLFLVTGLFVVAVLKLAAYLAILANPGGRRYLYAPLAVSLVALVAVVALVVFRVPSEILGVVSRRWSITVMDYVAGFLQGFSHTLIPVDLVFIGYAELKSAASDPLRRGARVPILVALWIAALWLAPIVGGLRESAAFVASWITVTALEAVYVYAFCRIAVCRPVLRLPRPAPRILVRGFGARFTAFADAYVEKFTKLFHLLHYVALIVGVFTTFSVIGLGMLGMYISYPLYALISLAPLGPLSIYSVLGLPAVFALTFRTWTERFLLTAAALGFKALLLVAFRRRKVLGIPVPLLVSVLPLALAFAGFLFWLGIGGSAAKAAQAWEMLLYFICLGVVSSYPVDLVVLSFLKFGDAARGEASWLWIPALVTFWTLLTVAAAIMALRSAPIHFSAPLIAVALLQFVYIALYTHKQR